ncbi:MAG TPA: DnaB-like helicase N-terminal domain-containing protein, partial [Aeromicrobium sp.]
MTEAMMEVSYDAHAETSVLAACLMSKPARDAARKHINGQDFYDKRNQTLWDAMSQLDRDSKGVDPAGLLSLLQTSDASVVALLPTLVTWPAVPEHVDQYAETVREWAVRRELWNATTRLRTKLAKPEASITGITSSVVTEFASIRDRGAVEDVESITLGELLSEEDETPDWLVPNLLERRDRLMLTGEEGLGKSYLLRQIVVMGA